jgi:DNA-binding CsgD family transcriptional regulator/tetratricopeptide (TPR) repeat protein
MGIREYTSSEAWLALGRGDWERARVLFEQVSAADPAPETFDGLGRSLWWLKDVRGSIEARTRAYSAFKESGRFGEAGRVAVWIARELRTLFRNDAAANGWLARAETLAATSPESTLGGWIRLARAESMPKPADARDLCVAALEMARSSGDGDLEVLSLARLGLIEVAVGEVDEGVTNLDEAMAAATAGEAKDTQSVAEAYCSLMEAAELLGDAERFSQWTRAITTLEGSHGFGPLTILATGPARGSLSAFCGACCGGLYLVTRRLEDAEDELIRAIAELEASEMHSRCVHPVTQLAEVRVLQGRFEEARTLLETYEDLPESVRPLAVLDLAVGEPRSAIARLQHRIEELADVPVGAFPLHTVLVDAHLANGDLDSALETAKVIRDVASLTQSKRHEGEALFSEGKVLAASGEARASAVLREAASTLSAASMGLTACRARMQLARVLVVSDRPVAISEARAALAAFDRVGAMPDADAAAAFLRELGVKGRTGPKDLEVLTKREWEVLRLVAQGLSNADIADRLFISVKTAGHHVSSILTKLGLRSRTEAAAFAAIHLPAESARI